MMKHVAFLTLGFSFFAGCSAQGPEGSGDGDGDSAEAGDGDGDTSGDGDEMNPGPDTGDDDIEIDPGDLDDDEMNPGDCKPKPIGLLRDFQSIYSSQSPIKDDQAALAQCPVYNDFQAPWPDAIDGIGHPESGIAAEILGPDRKPVIADPEHDYKTVTSPETFDAWYRDDPQCTKTFEYELPMVEDPVTGNLTFDSAAFFPLDGLGYGTSGASGTIPHNFHFTFELHMTFVYREGDVFNFTGDDDLYVYINDKLVLDLGGAHAPMSDAVNLDDLGLVPGTEYPIDFFHAERAESESNFHIETSLAFTNCDPIIVR